MYTLVNNDNDNDITACHYCVGADTDSLLTLLSIHLIFPAPL